MAHTTTTGMVHPFSNGSEADFWEARNCERCYRTQGENPDKMPSCPIAAALCKGRITGHIPLKLAKRAGYDEPRKHWPQTCAEFATVDPVARRRELDRLAAWNAGEPIRTGVR